MAHPILDIPGRCIGYLGAMGSGKSSSSLVHAMELAESIKAEWIVCNFSLDAVALAKYAIASRNMWAYHLILNGQIISKPIVDHDKKLTLSTFFTERNAIFVIDEAGIFFNCRDWKQIGTDFLADLAQARHDKRYLFWIAQDLEQVDKQIRTLTTGYVWCCGISRYNSKIEGPEQVLKFNRLYAGKDYEKLIASGKLSTSGLKATIQSTLKAKKIWFSFMNELDRMIFDCYPSFDRIGDSKEPKVLNQHLCKLVWQQVDWPQLPKSDFDFSF